MSTDELAQAAELPGGTPRRRWRVLTAGQRVLAVAAALGVVLAIVIGSQLLTPDPRGLGTHEQLGLPPCGTVRLFGIPCPFCGMTTAFVLAAQGHFAKAFVAQPAGLLLFVLGIVGAGACGLFGALGRWPDPILKREHARWLGWLALFVLAAAWLYKVVAHVASASP
ncbi:MAG: DUF2752 domain-containing protein [Candidatus Hydrogenedentes bacterium]|nr:DUF2752 domain-containing protein [Candidatus Hydrogenedentota bacterium]